MKEREKAEQLIKEFRKHVESHDALNFHCGKEQLANAKECALFMVNERLQELNFTHIGYGKGIMQGYQKAKNKYWSEVKAEIEKL